MLTIWFGGAEDESGFGVDAGVVGGKATGGGVEGRVVVVVVSEGWDVGGAKVNAVAAVSELPKPVKPLNREVGSED